MDSWHDFPGPNAGYILELYDRYRVDPGAVDEPRAPFSTGGCLLLNTRCHRLRQKQRLRCTRLSARRTWRKPSAARVIVAAQLDPLGSPPPGDPLLELAAHGVDEAALRRLPAELIGGPIAEQSANAWEAIEELRAVYSSTIGYDYDHITCPTNVSGCATPPSPGVSGWKTIPTNDGRCSTA